MAAAAGEAPAPAPSSPAGLLAHRAALALLDGEAIHAVVLYRRAVAAATGGQAAGFDAGPGPRGERSAGPARSPPPPLPAGRVSAFPPSGIAPGPRRRPA